MAFHDPSQGHAQTCPEERGSRQTVAIISQCYRTLSLPRKALRTANPLSEIRRRPLQTGRISKTSACRLLQGSPFTVMHIESVQGAVWLLSCSSSNCSSRQSSDLYISARNKANHHLVINFWPSSKLPATLLFVSSGPRIIEGHSVAVPRNQEKPNRDPFHSARSIHSLCSH
jgi:hypothetical protein